MEVWVNNILLKIEDRITLNKQSNNLTELKDRQTTFTNKFKIHKTKEIISLFENLGTTGNKSSIPYRKLVCKLISGGVELISNGQLVIRKTDKDYFHANIYDGNIFLFQEISNKKLSNINFYDLQHELTPNNYINSFSSTSGYIYALSDFGKINSLNNIIEINYQTPSIYFKEIWDRIFNETSFNFIGDFFQSLKWKNRVITVKRGYNSETDNVSNPISISDNNINMTQSGYSIFENYLSSRIVAVFNLFINTANQQILNGGVFTIQENNNYRLDIDLTVTGIPATLQGSKFFLKIYRNPSENVNGLPYIDAELVLTKEYLANNGNTLHIVDDVTIPLSVNDEVYIILESGLKTQNYGVPYTITITGNASFSNQNQSAVTINLASLIGDLKQKDFIKSVMQIYGLSIRNVPNTKTYEFKRIQEILTDYKNACDFSDKYIETKIESYALKGYAQKNIFGYNYFDEKGYKHSDGTFQIDNENLTPFKTIITLPYNACDISDNTINLNYLTYTPLWTEKRDSNGNIEAYKPINNNNYIADVVKQNESIKYGFSLQTPITYNGEVPRLNFDSLKWQSLLTENYKKIKEVLSTNLIKTIMVRMTAKEVFDFNTFSLIYIDKLGGYFYVNKIKYKGKVETELEVIKVSNNVVSISNATNIVANAGNYNQFPKGTPIVLLIGLMSSGEITSYQWDIISKPAGSNAVINYSNNVVAHLIPDFPGFYKIKLTVSDINGNQDIDTTIIVILQ